MSKENNIKWAEEQEKFFKRQLECFSNEREKLIHQVEKLEELSRTAVKMLGDMKSFKLSEESKIKKSKPKKSQIKKLNKSKN